MTDCGFLFFWGAAAAAALESGDGERGAVGSGELHLRRGEQARGPHAQLCPGRPG